MALVASGSVQANQTISNAALSERVQTSDEWIRTRTGIQSRRVSTPDESLNDLAIRAGQKALEMAAPEEAGQVLDTLSRAIWMNGDLPRAIEIQRELVQYVKSIDWDSGANHDIVVSRVAPYLPKGTALVEPPISTDSCP